MFVEAVLLGIAVGVLRKGRIGNLGDIHIKGLWLVILAFFVQLSPLALARAGVLEAYLLYFPFAAMVLMAGVLLLNLDKKGFGFIVAGTISNMLAILLNGMRMPVDFKGLEYAGLSGMIETIKDGSLINFSSMEAAEGVSQYLGKFIPLPDLYPFAKVLSVGDILIMIGIVYFVQGEMKRAFYRGSSSMVKYSYNTRV